VHPTSVTNTIDRLEADAMVERRRHPTDRRTTLAAITTEGRALVERATTVLDGIGYGMAALDHDDLVALRRIITRLRVATNDFVVE
jgi:DNA-binding MarR family transcriptional regulator